MAALPKRRLSSGRRNRRRAQDSLSKPTISTCPKCGATKRAHFQCEACGYYGSAPAKAATPKKTDAKAKTSKKS